MADESCPATQTREDRDHQWPYTSLLVDCRTEDETTCYDLISYFQKESNGGENDVIGVIYPFRGNKKQAAVIFETSVSANRVHGMPHAKYTVRPLRTVFSTVHATIDSQQWALLEGAWKDMNYYVENVVGGKLIVDKSGSEPSRSIVGTQLQIEEVDKYLISTLGKHLCSAQQCDTAEVSKASSANAQSSASGVVSESTELGNKTAGAPIRQTQFFPNTASSDATIDKNYCSSPGLQKKMSDNMEPSREGTCSHRITFPVDRFYQLQESALFEYPHLKALLHDRKSVTTVQVENPSHDMIAQVQDELKKLNTTPSGLIENGRRGEVSSMPKGIVLHREAASPFEVLNAKVHICNGDLTKTFVDAIVNPANRELRNVGGAALAIAEASGDEFYQFCTSYILEHGQLPTGKAAACTASGRLRKVGIKYVINCVGPAYYEFHDESGAMLTETVLNCLRKAEELRCESVAMPAISAGIFGVPISICTLAYVNAVFHFISFEHPQFVRNVYFVELHQHMCDAIRDEFAFRLPSLLEMTASRNLEFRSLTNSTTFCDDKQDHHWMNLGAAGTTSLPALMTEDEASYCSDKSLPTWQIPEKACFSSANGTSSTRFVSSTTSAGVTISTRNQPGCVAEVFKQGVPRLSTMLIDRSTGSEAPAVGIEAESIVTVTERSSQAEAAKSPPLSGDPECPICRDTMIDPTRLPCSHAFCSACVNHPEVMRSALCPECRVPFGIPQGNQPPNGKMSFVTSSKSLPGYPGVGTITIQYYIPSGIQNASHPNPGRRYSSTSRTAYLPDNQEGRDVLRMLTEAFNRGLIFTVGTSHTTGLTDRVVWNDIHHKTATDGGTTSYGYPDQHYLKRVKEELAAKGIR